MTDQTEPTSTVRNGDRAWWVNGLRHRTDGPAIEYADGHREWWVYGQLHRLDGPAVEYAHGDREWFVHGKCHRTDGPAVEYVDGDREWWVNGRDIADLVRPYIAMGMTDADAITAALIDLEREPLP